MQKDNKHRRQQLKRHVGKRKGRQSSIPGGRIVTPSWRPWTMRITRNYRENAISLPHSVRIKTSL